MAMQDVPFRSGTAFDSEAPDSTAPALRDPTQQERDGGAGGARKPTVLQCR